MGDIKRVIKEEQRRKQEERDKEDERFRNSSAFRRDRDNRSKAEKLRSFAPSVLKRFSKEVAQSLNMQEPIVLTTGSV